MISQSLFVERKPEFAVQRPPTSAELPASDGQPLESNQQREDISNCIDIVRFHSETGYTGGNMFVYYDPVAGGTKSLSPDFFHVLRATPEKERRNWVSWEENGELPDLILEFLSPSTSKRDRIGKKEIYEREFPTHEYFLYDYDAERFEGWRRSPVTKKFEPLTADKHGLFYSEVLNLYLASWTGTINHRTRVWPRFFLSPGKLAPHPTEAAQQEAERERRKSRDAIKQLDLAKQAKEVERQAKEDALAELARLKEKFGVQED